MLTISTFVASLMLTKHKGHEAALDYLEQDLHSLMAFMLAILTIVLILEGIIVDEGLVVIAHLRCALIILIGVWQIHICFTLYEGHHPRTDNIFPNPDSTQDTTDLVICIGYLVMSLFVVALVYGMVYLYLNFRQGNPLKSGDYTSLPTGQDHKL